MNKLAIWLLVGIVIVGSLVISISIPFAPHFPLNNVTELSTFYSYIYALSSVLLLLAAIATAIVVWQQLEDARRTRHRALFLQLFEQYSSKEMYFALVTVREKESFPRGSEEDARRRTVSNFFFVLASLVRHQVKDQDEEDMLYASFAEAVEIWTRFKASPQRNNA